MKDIPSTYQELEQRNQSLELEIRKLKADLQLKSNIQALSANAFALFDNEGIIKYVSPSFADLLQLEHAADITRTPFGELVQEESKRAVILEKTKNNGCWNGNCAVEMLNGDLQNLHLCITRLKAVQNELALFCASIVDIEEQSRLFEELKLNEERLQLTLAVTQIGIWDWDIKKDTWYASPIYYTMLGYEPVQGFGDRKVWLSRVHPEDLANVAQAIQNVLHYESKSYQYEARMRHADGSYRWQKVIGHAVEFDDTGNISRLIGIRMDINASKINELIINEKNEEIKLQNELYLQINEELIQTNCELQLAKEEIEISETKFKAIFENSQDAVAVSKNGVNFIANNAFLKLFAHQSLNEIQGRPTLEQIAPSEHSRILEYARKRANGEEVPSQYESIGRRSNGEEFPFEMTVGSYKLNNETYTIAILRDITERKEYENKLKQYNAELKLAMEKAEESDRLKTAFLQNMSHEIRTPMNAIVGFAKIMERPDLPEEKRKSFISIIVNSSNQLLSIVSDILTISSIATQQEKINIEEVCVNAIITELHDQFKSQAESHNIAFQHKQQLPDEASEIYTDGIKLNQILTNLLTNALKFTQQGSIKFGYSRNGDFLEFYVKDTGIGISQDMLTKIFERFRQENEGISRNYGGTGLGLTISKAFVELLGGKIWVESQAGSGSVFYFTLPYKPVHQTVAEANLRQRSTSSITILVAEDEEYNFLLIEEFLINMNYNLLHAKNGEESIQLCKENPRIELILMDIKMPIMDGYSAAKQIKSFRPQLPIIAQSAYLTDNEQKKKFNEIAFDDFISKPICEDHLKQKIKKFIT